jgi:hypothetical protein
VAAGGDFLTLPKPKIVVAKIDADTTIGDDKLTISGSFLLPTGTSFSALMPQIDGARILLENQNGDVRLDAILPAGLYDSTLKRGWKTNNKHSSWQYIDQSPAPIAGIKSFKVGDASRTAAGEVKVRVSGKNGTYPVVGSDDPLGATIVLGNQADAAAGLCGDSDFSAEQCASNQSHTTMSCK